MVDAVVVWGLVALGVAVLALAGAAVTGLRYRRRLTSERRAASDEAALLAVLDEIPTWDEQTRDNGGIPPVQVEIDTTPVPFKRNHRHNIHCPRCGRFARATALSGLTDCHVHGLVIRGGSTLEVTLLPEGDPTLALLTGPIILPPSLEESNPKENYHVPDDIAALTDLTTGDLDRPDEDRVAHRDQRSWSPNGERAGARSLANRMDPRAARDADPDAHE